MTLAQPTLHRFVQRVARRRRPAVAALALAVVASGLGLAAAPTPVRASELSGRTDWVSDPSWYGSDDVANYLFGMSDDGRSVLFNAGRPVPFGAGYGNTDPRPWGLSIRDMLTGEMRAVPAGANHGGVNPQLSGDGRFVVFVSQDPRLDPEASGDDDPDLYLVDMLTGEIRLVSPTLNPRNHGGEFRNVRLSGDGRYVVYATTLQILTGPGVAAGQTPNRGWPQVYRYDRITGLNTPVASRHGQVAGMSQGPAMSRDGRYVVFGSTASNLDSTDPRASLAENSTITLYERDMDTGRIWRITDAPVTDLTAPGPDHIAVSGDGATVAFEAWDAKQLTGLSDTNRSSDIFRWTRADGKVRLVSASSDGLAAAGGGSFQPAISADGSTIVFLSGAENLVAGIDDANNPEPGTFPPLDWVTSDVYVWRSGEMRLVSGAAGFDATGDRGSVDARISRDGSTVVFTSAASDLVADEDWEAEYDNTGLPYATDVFAYSFATESVRQVSIVDDAGEFPTPGWADISAVSADGAMVAFGWHENWVREGRSSSLVGRRLLRPPFPPPPPLDAGHGIAPRPGGPGSPQPGCPSCPPIGSGPGYWALAANGTVYSFGGAPSSGALPPGPAAVDIDAIPGGGYVVLREDGTVVASDDPEVFPAVASSQLRPGERPSSISVLPDGVGFWVFTDHGRVFPFGEAQSFGDLAATKLNGPVLDSVATPTGNGYYMVASDGGVFAFGDARFAGSTGAMRLNSPVRSLVPDGDGAGYWLVASDGGIFSFDAPFRGSMGHAKLNRPMRGMVRYGNGYLMVAEDGGIFNFSDQPFSGSLGSNPPSSPIVSVAAYEPD
jgi:Tol biopolymer transport system component